MTQTKRPFLSTSIFTALGRAGGFLIPFFVAIIFGATRVTDAFFLAYGILFAFSGVFNYLFESVLVPYLSEQKKNESALMEFANTALLLSLPAIAAFSVAVGILLPKGLVAFNGWDPAAADLVGRLFFEMLPMLLLGVWISQANGICFHHKIFWFAAVSPGLRSLVVIGLLFVFHKHFGIHILTWGFAAGEVIRWAMTLGLLCRRTSWKFSFLSKRTLEQVRGFFKQAGFQTLALLAVYLIVVTDQWFASRLGEGSLSLLSYADRLLQVPYILFLSGILQVFLPYWSDTYHHDPSAFWDKVNRDVRSVLIFIVPICVALWTGRFLLVQLIFHFSHFSAQEIHTIADVFGWFAVGFGAGIVRLLYGRLLLVIRHSAFYCFQSWTEFVMNTILDYVFSLYFGVAGIAMATTLVYFISSLWLHFYLKSQRSRTVR